DVSWILREPHGWLVVALARLRVLYRHRVVLIVIGTRDTVSASAHGGGQRLVNDNLGQRHSTGQYGWHQQREWSDLLGLFERKIPVRYRFCCRGLDCGGRRHFRRRSNARRLRRVATHA